MVKIKLKLDYTVKNTVYRENCLKRLNFFKKQAAKLELILLYQQDI